MDFAGVRLIAARLHQVAAMSMTCWVSDATGILITLVGLAVPLVHVRNGFIGLPTVEVDA